MLVPLSQMRIFPQQQVHYFPTDHKPVRIVLVVLLGDGNVQAGEVNILLDAEFWLLVGWELRLGGELSWGVLF